VLVPISEIVATALFELMKASIYK